MTLAYLSKRFAMGGKCPPSELCSLMASCWQSEIHARYASNFRNIQCLTLTLTLKRTRSEEHTSELQSLMRISYAVFCLKKKKTNEHNTKTIYTKNNKQKNNYTTKESTVKTT